MQINETEPVVTTGNEDLTVGTPAGKKNARVMAMAFGGFFLAVVVLTLGVGIYRVYAKAATDPFTVGVAKVLRLPLAKVNGDTLYYGEYINDLKAITTMRAYDQANGGQSASLNDQQLSDQVVIRLVNNALVSQLAKEMNLSVADGDVKQVYDELTTRFKTLEAAEKELQNHYGWGMAVYEKRVIRPLILQNKVAEKISTNVEERSAIQAQAQSVLDQIKKGGDFAALAKQYGQDGSAANGGDLGEFRKGDMVPAFESAVATLKKGELAPALVETEFGYHIVKLDDVQKEKVKDASGKTVQQDVYHARHILFQYPSINSHLSKKLQESMIRFYANIHNPFAEKPSTVAAQQ